MTLICRSMSGPEKKTPPSHTVFHGYMLLQVTDWQTHNWENMIELLVRSPRTFNTERNPAPPYTVYIYNYFVYNVMICT